MTTKRQTLVERYPSMKELVDKADNSIIDIVCMADQIGLDKNKPIKALILGYLKNIYIYKTINEMEGAICPER